MIKTSFLRELDKFHLVLSKKLASQFKGTKDSRAAGSGIIFRDYRDYVAGDEPKNIDWRLFGRTNKLYIKRREDERNLTVHVIVDASSSMGFGKTPSKFECASMLGLGFSYIALKNNEKFTFSTFSETLMPFRPKKGMGHLVTLLDHLNKTKPVGKSMFRKSLFNYKKFIGSRSLLIIISDFMFHLDELRETLIKYSKNDIIVVQVLSPEERNISLFGDMLLEDSEDHTHMKTYFSLREKRRYNENLEEHIKEIEKICLQAKARFLSVNTSDSVFDAFLKVLK